MEGVVNEASKATNANAAPKIIAFDFDKTLVTVCSSTRLSKKDLLSRTWLDIHGMRQVETKTSPEMMVPPGDFDPLAYKILESVASSGHTSVVVSCGGGGIIRSALEDAKMIHLVAKIYSPLSISQHEYLLCAKEEILEVVSKDFGVPRNNIMLVDDSEEHCRRSTEKGFHAVVVRDGLSEDIAASVRNFLL